MNQKHLSMDVLHIDCEQHTHVITEGIRRLLRSFRKRGIVVALSGGIDSSVTAALCVRACGAERVFGLHMPDRDSSPDTLSLSQAVSTHYGFDSALEPITPILETVGCYSRQEDAIREVVPEFGPGWKSKLVLESVLENEGYNFFHIVVQAPDGTRIARRASLKAYLGIVAATNFKQRVRKMMEYYHADRLNYAVAGTPNRLEYDQGSSSSWVTARPTSSRSRTSTRRRSTSWPSSWACPRRSAAVRLPPTRIACRRARRSSTSHCPTRRWTCASMPGTTVLRRSR